MESKFVGDHGRYVESFRVFSTACAKFADEAFDQWTEDVFSGEIIPQIRAAPSGQEELQVLGVGSGSGVLDCRMLEKLLPRFPTIKNRVVEPLQGQIDQFKALAQSKSHQLHGVEFDWRLQTIEQYVKAGDLTKFHLISAVHSLYYVDDVESTLMNMYDLVMPGGVLLVILISADCGQSRFVNRLRPFREDGDRRLDAVSKTAPAPAPAATTDKVQSALDRRAIPYKKYTQPAYMDVTQCFDETSEEGALLVDFLTHVVNFKQAASEDFYRQFMEYFGSSDCCRRRGGEVHLSIDFDTIVVSKPVTSTA